MNVDVVTNLKYKFIKDFDKVRYSLYGGVKPKVNILKYMMCVINDPEYFDSKTYEYLMTYE